MLRNYPMLTRYLVRAASGLLQAGLGLLVIYAADGELVRWLAYACVAVGVYQALSFPAPHPDGQGVGE